MKRNAVVSGIAMFCIVSGVVATGIAERAAWHIDCWKVKEHEEGGSSTPAHQCAEGRIANCAGLAVFGYVACVLYLVTKDAYKRQPLPEEQPYATVYD